MDFSLPYKITFGFLTSILILAVVSYFYFSSTQAFIQSSAKVQTSQKVINQLEVVMSLIKDAETGQRGFIITENELFLEPYYIASDNLEDELVELSLLIQDSVQKQRYDTLIPDVSSMMARLDFSIDLIKRNEFDSAVSYIVSITGKKYMDKIRNNIHIMKEAEKRNLETLANNAESNAEHTFLAVVLGAFLSSFILIWGLIRVILEFTRKKKAEAELKSANQELRETQESLKLANNELEQRVQQRTQALSISEKRYKSLISATTSIVWTANSEGKIIEEVPSWEQYTGQKYEEYMGLGWLDAIHPDDKDLIKQTWKNIQTTKAVLEIESKLLRGDGLYRHILLYGVPVTDADNSVQEWIGTISDIHDRKEAEEALLAKKIEVEKAYEKAEVSNAKLKSVNEVLETFVYAAAHDLKSPIINLKSLLSFINQTSNLDKKFEMIQRFDEAVMRLDNTISGLGEIIEVQEVDNSNVRAIYFQDILDQVNAEYSYKIIDYHADIVADFQQCQSIIYFESYITSIFSNMITNAIKYSKDEVPLRLEISSRKEKDIVVLIFKDNGIGMDLVRYGNNLFKPFKRFSNKAEGKGIGLHIIKSMIEKNGGKIEVHSEVNVGTEFVCHLKEYKLPVN